MVGSAWGSVLTSDCAFQLRYPIGRSEKQVDRRARELPGTYRRPLERLDRLHHGTPVGEVGRLVQRLQSFGELQTYVVGNWG